MHVLKILAALCAVWVLPTVAEQPPTIGETIVKSSPDVGKELFSPSAANPGCSARLKALPGGQVKWEGCITTACGGTETCDPVPVGNQRHCECSGNTEPGCYAQVTEVGGFVIDWWCDALGCDTCAKSTIPVPLPDGPPIIFYACDCL